MYRKRVQRNSSAHTDAQSQRCGSHGVRQPDSADPTSSVATEDGAQRRLWAAARPNPTPAAEEFPNITRIIPSHNPIRLLMWNL